MWFGEQLPTEAWERSVAAVAAADVAVVVGTSAIVYPAAGLPELALAEGVPVIEVNPERTPLSDSATISLRETAATALPELLQRLPALLRLGRPDRPPDRGFGGGHRNPRREHPLAPGVADLEAGFLIDCSVCRWV